MNKLYIGRSCDLNIGNCKTLSAVRDVLKQHFIHGKQIFSNIELIGVPYTPLTPESIPEVLETRDAVILFDELHAIIDINHKISPGCKKHSYVGLCYELSEMFRQVRKNNITTESTCQTFSDTVYRLKVMMQEIIICEKYHVETYNINGMSRKINVKCTTDICPLEHKEHKVKQTDYRTQQSTFVPNIEDYYGVYDSSEVVKGWIQQ